ncbi:hypothetical protein DENSPDRAFT_885837 [Dentipellis sp. KUC8613]|nr:hypothetical protein DENSPDRAFT_885837 [Dentipellis sp. KUC8613]
MSLRCTVASCCTLMPCHLCPLGASHMFAPPRNHTMRHRCTLRALPTANNARAIPSWCLKHLCAASDSPRALLLHPALEQQRRMRASRAHVLDFRPYTAISCPLARAALSCPSAALFRPSIALCHPSATLSCPPVLSLTTTAPPSCGRAPPARCRLTHPRQLLMPTRSSSPVTAMLPCSAAMHRHSTATRSVRPSRVSPPLLNPFATPLRPPCAAPCRITVLWCRTTPSGPCHATCALSCLMVPRRAVWISVASSGALWHTLAALWLPVVPFCNLPRPRNPLTTLPRHTVSRPIVPRCAPWCCVVPHAVWTAASHPVAPFHTPSCTIAPCRMVLHPVMPSRLPHCHLLLCL